MGHDQMLTQAVSLGNLELSQFLPLAAESLLAMLDLLARGCDVLARLCVAGLQADRQRCRRHVESSTATVTALIDALGYEAAGQLAARAAAAGKSLRQTAIDERLLSGPQFDDLIRPERVNRLGSSDPPPND